MPMTAPLLRRCAAVLLYTLACAAAAAQEQPQLPLLPPSAAIEQTLTALPALRAAQAGQALAQARSERLAAGPHDWVAKAGINRRRDTEGGRYNEAEIGLETTLRWPHKVATDRQLAAQALQLGALDAADAWHEAARTLLADWFEALQSTRSATLLQAQEGLMARLLHMTQQRVQAGEAARLDLLAAQAEHARWQAQAQRARSQAQLLRSQLQLRYPQLSPLPDVDAQALAAWPQPHTPAPGSATWVERILADNHELERAQARAEQARLQAERTGQERRPDPTVGWRATQERSGQERVIGLYLSLPLGSAGREADARAALVEADMAAQALEMVRQRVTLDAHQRAQEAVSSQQQLAQQRHALAQLQESAALQERAYALGETSLLELLQAQRSALEAGLLADSTALDALQAQAHLQLDAHQLWAPPQHTLLHHDGATPHHNAPTQGPPKGKPRAKLEVMHQSDAKVMH